MNNSLKVLSIAAFVLVIFYFALDVRSCIFKIIPPDSITYIDASNMLFDEMKPHPIRPLGYAFISGLPKIIYPSLSINQYIAFSVFVNILAWAFSIILFYKTLMIYFIDRVSFLFTLILIFSFSGVAHVFCMLTESIVCFFLSLITYCMLKYNKSKKTKHLIISTTLLNLAILIKPGFFYLGICASLGLIFFMIYIDKNIGSKKLLSFFILSITLIAIQNIEVYRNYGKLTTSFIDKITWYHYLGARSYAVANKIPLTSVKESRLLNLSDKSFGEISQICKDDFKWQMTNHPHVVFKQLILNIFENSIYGSDVIKLIQKENKNKLSGAFSKVLYKITALQNFVFIFVFLISVIMILRSFFSQNIAITLLASLVAYVILSSGISFWQGDRFHYILYQTIIAIFILLLKDKPFAQQWLKQQKP